MKSSLNAPYCLFALARCSGRANGCADMQNATAGSWNMPAVPTPTSHFFTSLRSRLHYLDWGNPSAPLLILVHGGFDHAHSWDWTARVLAQDFHVIAPDLRGHGDSAWSPTGAYPIAHFVYDLALLVDLLEVRGVAESQKATVLIHR